MYMCTVGVVKWSGGIDHSNAIFHFLFESYGFREKNYTVIVYTDNVKHTLYEGRERSCLSENTQGRFLRKQAMG